MPKLIPQVGNRTRLYTFALSHGVLTIEIPEQIETGEVYEIKQVIDLIVGSARKREGREESPEIPPALDPSYATLSSDI